MISFLWSFYPSTDSRRVVVSYKRNYGRLILVNHLGGLSLARNSVIRLADHPNMTVGVKQQKHTLFVGAN